MKNIKQWSLPIVIFHFLLIISIIVLFLTGDEESYILIHENFGYFILILIAYRVYYSFKSNKAHEKLSSWLHSRQDLIHFFRTFFNHKENKYHNPASSLVMIILISLLIINVITGSIGFTGEEGEGYLSYFIDVSYNLGESVLNLHELSSDLLLIFIIMHILGSIVSSIIIKHNIIYYIFKVKK
jgi:cytochrome b